MTDDAPSPRSAWYNLRHPKEAMLRKAGLQPEPLGVLTDHVEAKAKRWRSLKEWFDMPLVLAMYTAVFMLLLLPMWFIPTILFALLVGVTGWGVRASIELLYIKIYGARETWDATVHRSLTESVHDHWAIGVRERMKSDDPAIAEAKTIIDRVLERRRRAREASAPSAAGHAGEPPAARDGEVAVPCPVCYKTGHAGDAEYCGHCGAQLYPEEYYYKVQRVYGAEDDPYREVVIYSDCDIELHLQPLSRTIHVGKVPVTKPAPRVSFIQVGLIKNQTPLLMFVESKENITRVLQHERIAAASAERTDEAERLLDGYQSVTAAGIIRVQEHQITSLAKAADYAIEASAAEGGRVIDQFQRTGRVPAEPTKKTLTAQLKEHAKGILLVVVLLVLAVLFGLYVLPWLIHTVLTPSMTAFHGVLAAPPPTRLVLDVVGGASPATSLWRS